MMSKKSPRVNRVKGKVRKTRMGRTITLTIPSKKAATRADKKPSTQIIFGKRWEMIRMATMLTMKRRMKIITPPKNI
jgi:hypothetical protein